MGEPFDLRPGDVVARAYRIAKPIGVGGAGSVYQAHRIGDGVAVALKVMHDSDPSGVGRRRFEREAALVKRLQNPYVVDVLDFGHTELGLPFIVFGLLEGRSLKSAIRREGGLDELRTGRLSLQILDGLVAAHAMGIVHRDIKPANVFLVGSGVEETVKVLDFGLAKALFGEEQLLETLTKTGYRVGTPRYMSPEMARAEPVGAASDIYSLALVMGEMLAGEPLVGGNSQVKVMMEHASAKPIELPDAVKRSALCDVIGRGLAKSVHDRYPSAASMRQDLAAVVHAPRATGRLEQTLEDGGVNEPLALAETLAMEDQRMVPLRSQPGPAPTVPMYGEPGRSGGPQMPWLPSTSAMRRVDSAAPAPHGEASTSPPSRPPRTVVPMLVGLALLLLGAAAAAIAYLLSG